MRRPRTPLSRRSRIWLRRAERNSQKLRHIRMNYNIANAKVVVELTEEEKEAEKEGKGKGKEEKKA